MPFQVVYERPTPRLIFHCLGLDHLETVDFESRTRDFILEELHDCLNSCSKSYNDSCNYDVSFATRDLGAPQITALLLDFPG